MRVWALFCLVSLLVGVEANPLVFGHRGASGEAPENTIVSYELALEEGAEGIEVDLQLSSDMHLVAIHDPTLDRTTNCSKTEKGGCGFVKDHTLAQLEALDAGSWKNKKFTGVRIPTGQEVLEVLQVNTECNDECHIILDLKESSDSLLQQLKLALAETVLEKRAILGCWTYEFAKQTFETFGDEHTMMFITSMVPAREHFQQWKAIGMKVFSIDFLSLALDPEFVKAAHDAGFEVYVWTVDSPEDIATAKVWNVDAIITNYPTRAVKAVDAAVLSVESDEAKPVVQSDAALAFKTRDAHFDSKSKLALDWALRFCQEASTHRTFSNNHMRQWMAELSACRRVVAVDCGTLLHPEKNGLSELCNPLAKEILAAARSFQI